MTGAAACRPTRPTSSSSTFRRISTRTSRSSSTSAARERARALPMVRARMTHINGKPIDELKFATPRGQEFATRDQNITWSEKLGRDNEITAGHWFTAEEAGKPLVSVSTEYMEELNLKLGDSLQFDIAGETRTATHLQRAQGEVGQLPAELLPDVRARPARRLAGHLDDGRAPRRAAIRRPSPNWCAASRASRCSTWTTCCAQVRSVIDKALAAVQSVFLFTLLAGLVVLIAAVQASREERRYRKRHAAHARRESQHRAQGTAGGIRGARCAVRNPRRGGRLDRRHLRGQAHAADSVHAGSLGLGLRPRGRRVAGVSRGLAGHALGGQPAAGADLRGA